ncbi:MAG: hypothetical protein M3122_00300 [Actinomycetota bacterium]|nr:hypothetical protein [Actinomycetota bacterium]
MRVGYEDRVNGGEVEIGERHQGVAAVVGSVRNEGIASGGLSIGSTRRVFSPSRTTRVACRTRRISI